MRAIGGSEEFGASAWKELWWPASKFVITLPNNERPSGDEGGMQYL